MNRKLLKNFLSPAQIHYLALGAKGEEREFFLEKVAEIEKTVAGMPKTYEQDGKGENAIVSLRYFLVGATWHILEKDIDDDGEGQIQAFGYADLGYGREMGYISIKEIIGMGGEMDLYFTPKTVKELELNK